MKRHAKIVLTTIILVFFQCGKKTGFYPVKAQPELLEGSDVIISNFHATSYKEQSLEWDMQAKKSYTIQDTGLTHVYHFTIHFYDNGQIANTITAEKGIFDSSAGKFILKNNVLVQSANGRKLTTSELTWYEKSQVLFTDKPVQIELPEGDIISGIGLKADKKINRYELYQGHGFHPPE
ncbi:MAG: LPS export ABC transporter periplasmic protein LptC [Candidatus Hydrogenedentota bacterium]|nr:MAG: LPS export ABC transporter periplasmic protein LptC [Candidatus Hydrogenedentota bacterium]